ncbi:conserved hypothetical protein [Leishmania braziliensis MHOM/BR/75/M2904]|uniref:TAP42-like protein n=2 Tax=Leishmania braziliensis TaxID=5660 RepID=A4HE53_LEIBR|nr:conserved hypothetical protein [Leishmania braziliensis MHOM/BR/75/M2904]CAJ2474226.1 unnamed protein product [Leishmania braziliensis]CAJ2474733.1 unnamed protein product [Leishmania braziliensis]CAM39106.1 conserved hypothetical protein [Leishmania braziliensis MHOM/BR/75/M2904]SYZ66551.1 TAP42-like_family [Leishmania braziliensis MHOM/BR/75/M2904]
MSSSTDAARDAVTVKGHFTSLCDTYTAEVLNTSLASTDATLNGQICSLVVEFELFWRHLSVVGAFSPNDEIDDYSTTALEMLWTPYILADLFQRIQGPMKRVQVSRDGNSGESSSGTTQRQAGSGYERMQGEDVLRHSEQGSEAQPTETIARSAADLTFHFLREEELRSLSRQEALSRSHAWLKVFFEWMQNVQLLDKKTLDTYAVYRADQRSQRIELSRTIASLRATLKAEDDKVSYLRAKRRRMRELMAEEGESLEETGGEEEETLRARALARLKWSIYEGCHQLQISSRELSMLEALNPEQRATISKQYQDTMDAVRRGELSLGRHTYTILPGGMMATGTVDHPQQVRASDIVQSGGVTAPAVTMAGAVSSSLVFNGAKNTELYRQQVRNELMMDRNAPTMTLKEFAELEMAEVQRQMSEAQARQQQQAEEDACLGPDGVEERQRQKDSAWDNWKDDHPVYGLTNKGNYS